MLSANLGQKPPRSRFPHRLHHIKDVEDARWFYTMRSTNEARIIRVPSFAITRRRLVKTSFTSTIFFVVAILPFVVVVVVAVAFK